MLIIEITDTKNGAAIYTALGQSSASLGKLARLLMAADTPDGPWEARRNGKTAMYGRSVAELARWEVSEGDKRTVFVRWKPHPFAA